MDKYIEINGACENNLKNISLRIPKYKMVVLTGLSGSGKSSLAMDTLQKECQRQYMESMGKVTDSLSKPKVDSIKGLSPSISVGQYNNNKNPRSTVGTVTEIYTYIRVLFAKLGERPCPNCGKIIKPTFEQDEEVEIWDDELGDEKVVCSNCKEDLEKLTMAHFSFNKQKGVCQKCKGLGLVTEVDLDSILDEEKNILEGAVSEWKGWQIEYNADVLQAAAEHYGFSFDPKKAVKDYNEVQRDLLLHGVKSEEFKEHFPDIKAPKKVGDGNFKGIVTRILENYSESTDNPKKRKKLKKKLIQKECPKCKGTKLREESRLVEVNNTVITSLFKFSLNDLLNWLKELEDNISKASLAVVRPIIDDLLERIKGLIDVGLDYLNIDRPAVSLSGGEAQRLRLASLLGSGLTGVLYILDEPTAGLHRRDTDKLIKVLKQLRNRGNTILVIEHDIDFIKKADYIIDIGPEAGENGGEVVATGSLEEVIKSEKSITASYLTGDKKARYIKTNSRAINRDCLRIEKASEHNLKEITVDIPLNNLVSITGVSGSGKSTLVFDILDKAIRRKFYDSSEMPGKYNKISGIEKINKVITVDQSQIGRMSRSNIATYTDIFTTIRKLFSNLEQAKNKGLSSKHFSFNSSGGRCKKCKGLGVINLDMHFLPDAQVTCPVCHGKRFKKDILEVKYRDYNISEILNLTVNQAISIFEDEKKIIDKLLLMSEIGLGYLRLGQPTTTLSGGEAQRIKLTKELGKNSNGNTLYLLDEPTTGLHPHDIDELFILLNKLVNRGNTVVVIEHNLDLIARSDWVIDLGPEGGKNGGYIVAEGTPEQVMKNNQGYTGKYLQEVIN
ncbi:excinuclease ABC subunit UvrA [Halanaerobium kushneri]|uniref:UvrABC system protein A n=1 Tax=Halanaerobium kushneri TaxID=56779 RepID=A0A1N6PHW6_9FIRM|nr:excinuclease ABC subunit UvrA [Halanaerobium kushneri]SIQ03877.1 excinuclease ABC subunit A [Halanaerobium kushneri]